jgi:hypothetical protein
MPTEASPLRSKITYLLGDKQCLFCTPSGGWPISPDSNKLRPVISVLQVCAAQAIRDGSSVGSDFPATVILWQQIAQIDQTDKQE